MTILMKNCSYEDNLPSSQDLGVQTTENPDNNTKKCYLFANRACDVFSGLMHGPVGTPRSYQQQLPESVQRIVVSIGNNTFFRSFAVEP